jgi:hypothetical protein
MSSPRFPPPDSASDLDAKLQQLAERFSNIRKAQDALLDNVGQLGTGASRHALLLASVQHRAAAGTGFVNVSAHGSVAHATQAALMPQHLQI